MSALTERKLLDNTLFFFFDNGGNAEAGISGKYIGKTQVILIQMFLLDVAGLN